ncbi:unnamed protein product, partial [Amoebophrya sp. A25]|eukprot:GSA25T00017357001.1
MLSLPTTLFSWLSALAQVCECRTTTPQVPQQVEEEAQDPQAQTREALIAGEARHHQVAREVAGFLQPQTSTRADPSPTS